MNEMSDRTHLTHFAEDKDAWPVYITIRNHLLSRRNTLVSMASLRLAVLPNGPNFAKINGADKPWRQINARILQRVFQLIFIP